jgi:hypothetical protein
MPAPAYIISRIGDPIFAVVIGLGAASTRINREEKELGRSTQQTIDAAFRYTLLPSMESINILIACRRTGLSKVQDATSTKKN